MIALAILAGLLLIFAPPSRAGGDDTDALPAFTGPYCVSFSDHSQPDSAISVRVCGGPELEAHFLELLKRLG